MATAKFYLKNPKDGHTLKLVEVSIVLKFTISRNERFEISTGEKIVPRYWDGKKQEVKSNHGKHVEINLSLRRIKSDVVQLWRDNKAADVRTLRALAEPIVKTGQPATEEKKTLIEVVKSFLVQYEKEKLASSARRYAGLLHKLIAFQDVYPLELQKLDFNFYDAFKNWLYSYPNPLYREYSLHREDDIYIMRKDNEGDPVGLMDEVVYKYFINLKTVLSWAYERGYNVNPIFKKWPIIRRDYRIIRLTADELERLEAATLPVIKLPYNNNGKSITLNLDIVRDYLVLECRTGQRISDIKRFSIKQLNGNQWTLTQKKGNRLLSKTRTIPFEGFTLPAYYILLKYNFILPAMADSYINLGIKEVCKRAGIDQEMYIERWAGNKKIRIPGKKYEFISTHTGRKTFVTLMLSQPGVSDATVMYLTGIENYKTLKHYRDDVELLTVTEQLRTTGDGKSLMKKAN